MTISQKSAEVLYDNLVLTINTIYLNVTFWSSFLFCNVVVKLKLMLVKKMSLVKLKVCENEGTFTTDEPMIFCILYKRIITEDICFQGINHLKTANYIKMYH